MKPVYTLAAWPEAAAAAKSPARGTRQHWLRTVDQSISQAKDAGDRLLLHSIRRTIRQKFELAAAAIINAQEALDRFRPGVLVVGNDLTIEGRAACRVAAHRKVPTVAFMHGALANNPLHARHCADRFLVYGPRHRDDLLRRGLAEQQVVVIGAPHLDARRHQSGQLDPRLQAAFDLRPGAPWMLVATSGPGNAISMAHHQRIVEQLGQLAARFPQVPIVIKLHRKDRPENYRALQNTSAAARVAISPYGDPRVPYDIFEWLQGCPLLLTGTSTVAVEAMLMDVPVVTMDFCSETQGVDFIDEGATLHCRTGEQLEAAVRQVLSDTLPLEVKARAQAYVASAFYQLDGGAAQRGADIICQLASRTSP